jgi:hypothetical protein
MLSNEAPGIKVNIPQREGARLRVNQGGLFRGVTASKQGEKQHPDAATAWNERNPKTPMLTGRIDLSGGPKLSRPRKLPASQPLHLLAFSDLKRHPRVVSIR